LCVTLSVNCHSFLFAICHLYRDAQATIPWKLFE
jgi:hypothetical protein